MELTENERKVIEAYKKDDFVNDFGWDSKSAAAWLPFHKECGLPGKVFSGTLSKMIDRGLAWSNGESFGLTQKCIGIIKKQSVEQTERV